MDVRALLLPCVVVLGCGGADSMSMLSGGASESAGDTRGRSSDGSTSSGSGSMSASEADTTSTTGSSEDSSGDGSTAGSNATVTSGSATSGSTTGDGESRESDSASTGNAESSSSGTSGGIVQDGVLDIRIFAHNDCTFTTEPASITVPQGTAFTVNWINDPSSEVEVDVAKMNPTPNHVPIIIGMEVGTSYHDEIREWCGSLFTGTFDFRVTSCFDPHYIPVDCGG